MAAKKRFNWGIVGILVIMAIYAGSLRVDSIKNSIHSFGSWCCFAGIAVQQAALYPIQRWYTYGASVTSLHDRIERLQKERDALWEELTRREGVATYGQDTDDVRSYAERYQYKGELILAQCILKECSPGQQVIVVDKGTRHGVTDSMVAVYKNMLVGRVSEVQPWHSKITLITDTLCKISAFCVKTRAQGIIEGTNQSNALNLCYISHLSSVEVGDEVLSSGQGLIFPRGFALGTVASCEVDGLYQKVTVKPCLDVSALHFCYLLEKGAMSGIEEVTPELDAEQKKEKL